MKRQLLLVMAFALFVVFSAKGQRIAVKNNLLYDALLTPNVSVEVALGEKFTLDTQLGANYFFYTTNSISPAYTTKKWSHWLLQPEVRYWTCDVFNGWFFGFHLHGGQMNVGGVNIPLFILQNKNGMMKNHRYEGYFFGGGISAGYQLPISDRFNMELSLGLGYARLVYDKFKCATCGEREGQGAADYLGPTKSTLSLVYLF